MRNDEENDKDYKCMSEEVSGIKERESNKESGEKEKKREREAK